MPARSEERTNARKEEIINACEMLYQTMNFKDITINRKCHLFFQNIDI